MRWSSSALEADVPARPHERAGGRRRYSARAERARVVATPHLVREPPWNRDRRDVRNRPIRFRDRASAAHMRWDWSARRLPAENRSRTARLTSTGCCTARGRRARDARVEHKRHGRHDASEASSASPRPRLIRCSGGAAPCASPKYSIRSASCDRETGSGTLAPRAFNIAAAERAIAPELIHRIVAEAPLLDWTIDFGGERLPAS